MSGYTADQLWNSSLLFEACTTSIPRHFSSRAGFSEELTEPAPAQKHLESIVPQNKFDQIWDHIELTPTSPTSLLLNSDHAKPWDLWPLGTGFIILWALSKCLYDKRFVCICVSLNSASHYHTVPVLKMSQVCWRVFRTWPIKNPHDHHRVTDPHFIPPPQRFIQGTLCSQDRGSSGPGQVQLTKSVHHFTLKYTFNIFQVIILIYLFYNYFTFYYYYYYYLICLFI